MVSFLQLGNLRQLINSRCAVEFPELCQSFALTPTFTKVANPKATRWKKSAKNFEETVVKEEILQKKSQIKMHGKEFINIYEEIKKKSSTLRYRCILRVMNRINKDLYQRVMKIHTRKTFRMLPRDTSVDEHIQNISSFKLTFFQKLVLCRGLNFAIPRPTCQRRIYKHPLKVRTKHLSTTEENKKEIWRL